MIPTARKFWTFCVLRQKAYWRHQSGDGPPFSSDPALARYHFCNVYREADYGTLWFQAHRPGVARATGHWETSTPRPQERALKDLAASLLYRPVNKVSTFETWGGLPHAANAMEFARWLRDKRGQRMFTGRHRTRGTPVYAQLAKAIADPSFIAIQQGIWAAVQAGRLAAITRSLQTLPNIGPFFAWQVTCDLTESGHFTGQLEDWALLGPGSRTGAALIDWYDTPIDTARALRDVQPRDGSLIPPPQAPGSFSLKNVEHALCEYARWIRASSPGVASLEVKPWAK